MIKAQKLGRQDGSSDEGEGSAGGDFAVADRGGSSAAVVEDESDIRWLFEPSHGLAGHSAISRVGSKTLARNKHLVAGSMIR
jgi:hypothetical protein